MSDKKVEEQQWPRKDGFSMKPGASNFIDENGKPVHVDTVNHPTHYNHGKIEVIEFIEDQKMGYHLGNAVKYICRAGRKDESKYVEDLEKAIWYIRRRIELKRENPRRPNAMAGKDLPPPASGHLTGDDPFAE